MEILSEIGDLSIVAYVISSMLLMGLSQQFSDVIAPMKKIRTVAVALGVNFIAAPLIAYLLSRVIPIQPAHAAGLLLLGGAAGAPFIPKLAELAGGNVAHAVAMTVLLMVGSVIYIPLILPLILPGVSADPLRIAKPLFLMMLLPLAVGFTLNAHARKVSKALLPGLTTLSNLTFMLLLVLLVGLNMQALLDTVGSFAIGAYALFVLAMVILGYASGGDDPRTRVGFALACGQRNTSAALVVAVDSFEDKGVAVMVLVGAVVGLLMLLGSGRILRIR